MSIKVKYQGRTGNNMFQYAYARLMAESTGLPLETPWCDPDFIEVTQMAKSKIKEEGEAVVLDGYFQNVKYYNGKKDQIKSFWKLPEIKKNTKDMVIHLRLGDYYHPNLRCVICPQWYWQVCKMEKYEKLYIVVQKDTFEKKYLTFFNNIKYELVTGGTPKEEFEFIRSFDRIACSNSSFCWWAAYLSDASKIYTIKKWMNGKDGLNLAQMEGAIQVDGGYYIDRAAEQAYFSKPELTNYWREYKWKAIQ